MNTHLQIRRFLYSLNLWICYQTAIYTSRELMTSMSVPNDLYSLFQSCKSSVLIYYFLVGSARPPFWIDWSTLDSMFSLRSCEWIYSQTAEHKTLKLIQLKRFRLATCQELKEKRRQWTIGTSVVNFCTVETGFAIICHAVPSKTWRSLTSKHAF